MTGEEQEYYKSMIEHVAQDKEFRAKLPRPLREDEVIEIAEAAVRAHLVYIGLMELTLETIEADRARLGEPN